MRMARCIWKTQFIETNGFMKDSNECLVYEENSVDTMLYWSMERVLCKDDEVRESCPNLSVEEIDCKQSQEKVYIPKRNDWSSSPQWHSKEHKTCKVLIL